MKWLHLLLSLLLCWSCGSSQHQRTAIYETTRVGVEEIDEAVSDFYGKRHRHCLQLAKRYETYQGCMVPAEKAASALAALHSSLDQVYQEVIRPCKIAETLSGLRAVFTHRSIEKMATMVKEVCE